MTNIWVVITNYDTEDDYRIVGAYLKEKSAIYAVDNFFLQNNIDVNNVMFDDVDRWSWSEEVENSDEDNDYFIQINYAGLV